jgi:hypothetical protein
MKCKYCNEEIENLSCEWTKNHSATLKLDETGDLEIDDDTDFIQDISYIISCDNCGKVIYAGNDGLEKAEEMLKNPNITEEKGLEDEKDIKKEMQTEDDLLENERYAKTEEEEANADRDEDINGERQEEFRN